MSCLYDNRFAGPDCKEYLGSYWNDVAKVNENCGSSFIEENPRVVQAACPATVEIDGQKVPAKGVCHVDIGRNTALDVYSYDGPIDRLASACEVHMSGVFEVLVDDGTSATVHLPLDEALDALDSQDDVTVSSQCKDAECLQEMIEKGETFDFSPVGQAAQNGFIIYPAGNVDPRVYAPSALALAKQGIFVSIVPMENYLPLNGYSDANLVLERHPDVSRWFVGGHGLGGTMAVRYGGGAIDSKIVGLILWSAVAGEAYSMADSDLKVLSVFGQLDENYNADEMQNFAHTLPKDTVYICIAGGDYSQFGYYSDETSKATISRDAQQEQVILSTHQFIVDPASLMGLDCPDE